MLWGKGRLMIGIFGESFPSTIREHLAPTANTSLRMAPVAPVLLGSFAWGDRFSSGDIRSSQHVRTAFAVSGEMLIGSGHLGVARGFARWPGALQAKSRLVGVFSF